jgi:aspartyl/asparaginyl beta-hydroxylase (cupin superfamily)
MPRPRSAPQNTRQSRQVAVRKFLWDAGAHQVSVARSCTLYEHLLNTGELLRRWRQPEAVALAGALCQIYSNQFSSRPIATRVARDAIRDLVGMTAERLAWLFGAISWIHLAEHLDEMPDVPKTGMMVNLRPPDHHDKIAVSRNDLLYLLAMHMASEAEGSSGESGEPGLWLARISRIGSHIRRNGRDAPPVFAGCSETVLLDAEVGARDKYLAGMDALCRDINVADQYFASAHASCPWTAEPLIWRAFVALWRMDVAEADSLSREAAAVMHVWGTAWDKRLTFNEWLWLLSVLQRGIDGGTAAGTLAVPSTADPRDFVRSIGRSAQDVGGWSFVADSATDSPIGLLPPGLPAHGGASPATEESGARLDQFLHSFQSNHAAPLMPRYPGLSSRAWHDPGRFELTHSLKASFEQIRSEALAVAESGFHSESEAILRSGDWDVFFLFESGRKNEANCARCPITTRIIDQNRTMKTMAGLAYFSRLDPDTHIAAHRGPTNQRVRCHFALEVPEGDCGIRVGAEQRAWRPGECLVFDDSLEHEAWNRTASPRIVLIVDLWHPDLSPTEIAVLEGMHRYGFTAARELNQYWSANATAREIRADTRRQRILR